MILNREVNGMEVSGACLEGIMLNEISQRKTKTLSLKLESKKVKLRETE